MKIFVKVKTRAKEEFVEKIDDTHFLVSVKESRQKKEKANLAVIKNLADYFNVGSSQIKIVSGAHEEEESCGDFLLERKKERANTKKNSNKFCCL